MTWRIHSWSPSSGTGTVASPHFGPWPFGPKENRFETDDFEVDEEVLVELDGEKDAYVVRSVASACQRQPAGTGWLALEALRGTRPADMRLDERTDSELRFWLGDCCEWCSDSLILAFRQVSFDDLASDPDFDCPLLRLASAAECADRSLPVPDGSTAYCIVTSHGNGRDGPRVFIVAEDVEFEVRPVRNDR